MKKKNYTIEKLEKAKKYAAYLGKNFQSERKMMKFFFKEERKNPDFQMNGLVASVFSESQFMNRNVKLYAKVVGKNYTNDREMAKFFVEERDGNPNFKDNIQTVMYLIEEKNIKNADDITNEDIQKIKNVVKERTLQIGMYEKYGFNSGYIAEGPYHASLNIVLAPVKRHYHELSSDERKSILGNYDMIGGTFTLSENEEGELQVDIKMEEDVKEEGKTTQVESNSKKSTKMQGLYDDMPDDVKKSYDDMMKESFSRDLDKLTNEEVAYLNAFFKNWCKSIDVDKIDAEDAKVYAIYTKVKNRYNKLVKQFGNIEITKDLSSISKASEVISAKIK